MARQALLAFCKKRLKHQQFPPQGRELERIGKKWEVKGKGEEAAGTKVRKGRERGLPLVTVVGKNQRKSSGLRREKAHSRC